MPGPLRLSEFRVKQTVMSDSSSSVAEPVVEFAKYLTPLDRIERKQAKETVEARVRVADACAENLAAPRLLTAQEAAEVHAFRVARTREAIIQLGYGEQMHRLGGSSENSTACREAIVMQVKIEHGLEAAEIERIIREIVSGRGNGLLEPLDVFSCDLQDEHVLIEPLIYERNLHAFIGPEGSNKTIMALWMLATLASKGE